MKQASTWLVANWKMNGNAAEVAEYVAAVDAALQGAKGGVEAVLCPPLVYITRAVKKLPEKARLAIGAQNCHEKTHGAFTGEVSADMLADIGARYVILGHSERRAAGETEEHIHAKAQAAIAAGLTPILCVGESQAAYTEKKTNDMLSAQLLLLATLPPETYIVAYEPIWAIGSGATPTLEEIAAAHSHIKSVLGSAVPVLYGGSVNAQNAKEILRLGPVSGALIGGASLKAESMNAIIAAA